MTFRVDDQIQKADEDQVFRALLAYNLSHLGDVVPKDLGVYLEDEEGALTAGLIAHTHGNWLCIKYLWVSEHLRGQGVGGKILAQAEQTARARGCRYAFVDTYSFQAPAFYKKQGYKTVFTLEDYPRTGQRYYYTKNLTTE